MPRFVALSLVAVLLVSGCFTDVEPGFVGILVIKTGTNRGVDRHPRVGRVYEGVNEDTIVFPISLQNVIWTRAVTEGNPVDESITFAASGGVEVNVDVGLTFRVDPNKAADLYLRYHQNELSALADGEIRNITRDALARGASAMQVENLLAEGRNTLLNTALEDVRGRLAPHGIIVENLTFTSAPRLPANVQHAINASLEARQRLAQAEAQARSARATAEGEAAAVLARARGDADALLIRTQADARNRLLMAQAEAQANEIIELSTTSRVLRYRALQRWNGVLPTVSSSSQTFLATDVPAAEPTTGDRHARLVQLLNAIPTTSPTQSTALAPATAR